MDALIKRMLAIGDTRGVLHALQTSVVHEAQALVPRKTGRLQDSIKPGYLAATSADVVVRENYARFVEEGTGLFGPRKQRIVPKNGKVMVWKGGGPTKVRLSGRSRTRGGSPIAGKVFASSTKGMKARPYLLPGARKAVSKAGLSETVIKLWNGAA
jgi:hypothetical protein